MEVCYFNQPLKNNCELKIDNISQNSTSQNTPQNSIQPLKIMKNLKLEDQTNQISFLISNPEKTYIFMRNAQNIAELNNNDKREIISLPEEFKTISNLHCLLQYNQQTKTYQIQDLGTINGTFLHMENQRPYIYNKEILLELGHTTIQFDKPFYNELTNQFNINCTVVETHTGECDQTQINSVYFPVPINSELVIGRNNFLRITKSPDLFMSSQHLKFKAKMVNNVPTLYMIDISRNSSMIRFSKKLQKSGFININHGDIIQLGTTVELNKQPLAFKISLN